MASQLSNMFNINEREFKVEMRELLSPLCYKAKLTFAILICERFYALYAVFQRRFKWGNSHYLLAAISCIYRNLILNEEISKVQAKILSDKLLEIAPDEPYFQGCLQAFALDACVTICYILDFIIERDPENVINVSMTPIEAIQTSIREVHRAVGFHDLKKELESKFVAKELYIQKQMIKVLSNLNMGSIDAEIVKALRPRDAIVNLSALDFLIKRSL